MATLLLVATTLLAQSLASSNSGDSCSISGIVSNGNTGAPLKKASVHVMQRASRRNVNNSPSVRSVTTDADGLFRMDNVSPGKFVLVADRNSYASASTESECANGQSVTGISVKLMPEGMIFGKIIDEDGDPVSGAEVRAFRTNWSRGTLEYYQLQSTNSQADGSFVLGGFSPGRFLISATATRRPPPDEAFLPVYYPNSLDPSTATPIVVAAGAEVRGIQISVRSSRTFAIRGKVINSLTGSPASGISLNLSKSGQPAFGFHGTMTRSDGSFQFEQVLPGEYLVQATSPIPQAGGTIRFEGSQQLVIATPISVGNSDIDDLTLVLTRGAEITGVVKMNGALKNASVSLASVNNAGWNYGGQARDGEFAIHGVPPSRYRLEVSNLPDNSYLKSVRFAGQDITGEQLDLTGGGGGILEINLSPNPGLIGGIARDSNSNPVNLAEIQLWSKNGELLRRIDTSPDGQFLFRNLAPGDYAVLAVESIEPGASGNPAFHKAFSSQMAAVTVHEDSQESITVLVVPKAAVDAEVAKLQ